ncbi:hypothetical protein ANO11243_066520 [Dothideomycetidae sp. 11243]|nr:hypothetical protein ANO11243_066520 [fungal sp. No.11243]
MAFLLLSLLALLSLALAHGGHDQSPLAPDADWASRHMAEEHHISSFDASSFFSLHDYSSRGTWDGDDILKTYGLRDASLSHLPSSAREDVVKRILNIYDANHDGVVSREEFVSKFEKGERLPDLGHGPGHHGDDEYEYEIHHFEKYHGEDAKEEDLVHPEDIAHFKHHDEMERLEEELERMEAQAGVVEANIPGKFRRG